MFDMEGHGVVRGIEIETVALEEEDEGRYQATSEGRSYWCKQATQYLYIIDASIYGSMTIILHMIHPLPPRLYTAEYNESTF